MHIRSQAQYEQYCLTQTLLPQIILFFILVGITNGGRKGMVVFVPRSV